jgi:drug/metabolite transporter (DMT)-like permease
VGDGTRGTTSTRTWVALWIVYIIWGSTYLAIRVGVAPSVGTGMPPLLLSGTRFTVAGIAMLAIFGRRPAADGGPDPVGARQWLASAIVGCGLLLGGNGLVTFGEQHIASGTAALIVASVPIIAAAISVGLGRERLGVQRALGLAVGLAGVAVLSLSTGGRNSGIGVIEVVGAAVCWSAASVYGTTAPVPRRPLVAVGLEMLTGGVASLIVSGATGEWSRFVPSAVPARSWWALVYLVVAGSMVAYTAYAWLLANAPLSLTTTYAYVNPVVAVLLGDVILGENLTGRTALAAALVIAGVIMVIARTGSPPEPGPTTTGRAGDQARGAVTSPGDP